MGRRKERRLAAMSGGGRRVKLDLFAEPSGDLGGSSDQNEVGGNDDGTKNQAGLPNSPSTSGQQIENPLVLLGQYSDDELDEESSGEQVQAVSGATPVTVEHQENVDAMQENEDFGLEERNTSGSLNAEHLEIDNPLHLSEILRNTEVDHTTNNLGVESGVIPEETSLKEHASATSFAQAVGDVIMGWKVVLHEGSNQYYYWNTATGETSWEVPDILIQTSESTDGKRDTADSGKKEKVSGTLDQSTEVNGRNSCESSMEVLNEECRGELLDENTDLEQSQLKGSSCPNGALDHATLPGSNIFCSESNNGREDNVNGIESVMSETGELASSLVKCGEHLLDQLNSVTGSKCNMQGYNLILKYVSEIETRLADIKSLSSYGTSLLPFWLHSQKQLQKLEIDVRDAFRSLESGQLKDVGAENGSHEIICNVSETNHNEKNAVCSSGDSGVPDSSETTKLQKNEMEVYSRGVSSSKFVSSDGCLTTYTDSNLGGKAEDGIVGHCEATPQPLHCAEEIDMDIDMEVEDANPTSICTLVDPAQHHIPLEEFAAVREMGSIPPPPDEDWIPPPPPDAEPFPPPPPDEPPEILFSQVPDVESTQSFSYAEQYMSYNGPIYGYYVQANTDLPSSNLYVTAEASQPTLSHPPTYFEQVPNGYPATLVVNSVEPSVYYTLQDQQPTESSGSHSSIIPKTSISEAMGPLHTHIELESASLLKEVNVPSVDGDPKKAILEIQSSQAFHQDLVTTSNTDNVTVLPVPATTAPVAPTTTKTQSKVTRAKKKSVTSVSSLRSNKKVSSLVDKWKAAKEELQEEEEEPRSALEMLEKKKQREIEGWYAQQIASGEAKDNANFQPLGGDWRERVKRKRARLASEPSQASSDAVTEGNRPNLEEVSRGLPNGWQAYWDDSSKQVYYGNSVTSETTWVRPTS